jgi:hypothetical protein
MSLFSNISKLCITENIFISNLEDELGFGRGSIYKWDVNKPSVDKVAKVAQYFGVSVDSLIKDNNVDSDQLVDALTDELSTIEKRIQHDHLKAKSIKQQLKRLQKMQKGA